MEIVDANIFVRSITQDDAIMAPRALAYFDALAEEPVRAMTTEAVIAEVVFILGAKRHYGLTRTRIVDEVGAILALPGLVIEHPTAVRRALVVYHISTVDFPDALVVAHAERIGADAIVSFDRDYDRFPSVTRRDP